MKVSLNTIRQYTDVDLPVDDLVAKINAQLGGVEEVIDFEERYKLAIIVKVVSAIKHPNADRLNVCKVDDGGVIEDLERDENGYVQVVCGAPNAREGIFAVWLPPKATVPASYNEKELLVLDAREIRGEKSNGMLAAADELAIGSDHEGILEIDPNEWRPNSVEIKPGASFATIYGLDDTIIDIENKMFTHRPDLFGQLGVAREIAGIQHKRFNTPEWYLNAPDFKDTDELELIVFNEAGDNVPRFMAVALKDVTVKPSPLWLQCELVRLGGKPINNIVDVTNYIMLLTSQPTHAYDYDKLRGNTLGARMASDKEPAHLLNGKSYQLTTNDIVIVDGEGVVGLGGVMGGGNSEVSADTKNIVLEVANFNMYTVRKMSMRYGLFTEAVTRFNKGQSAHQNGHVLNLLMQSIFDVAGGMQASKVFGAEYADERTSLSVTTDFINQRLGLGLDGHTIVSLLENVEIRTKEVDGSIEVTIPFWRTDLELPEDIVEEVGRLYGFDKLTQELPKRTAKAAPKNNKRDLENTIRQTLRRSGANEVLTYSFVHEKLLKKANQSPESAYRISNALSPDLQYLRLSVVPSLLDKVSMNIKAGHEEFALFEIGRAHTKQAELVDGLPPEQQRAAFVYASKHDSKDSAYYVAKRYLDELANELGISLQYKPLSTDTKLSAALPFDQVRRARVIDAVSGYPVAIIGEFSETVEKNFKLPMRTAGFELLTEGLLLATKTLGSKYSPLGKFQSVERDLCYRVSHVTTYESLVETSKEVLAFYDVQAVITPVDAYSDSDDAKQITFRVRLSPNNATLTSAEVSEMVDAVSARLAEKFDATLV